LIFLITESASDDALSSRVSTVLQLTFLQTKLRRTSRFSSVNSIGLPQFGQGIPALPVTGRVVISAISGPGFLMDMFRHA